MYSFRDIILLTLVAVSLPICFFRPFFGVLLWTLFAFLNPQDFAWGMGRQMSLAQAIAIPTLVGTVIFSPAWKRLFCREVALLAILWLWFTLTTFNSTHEVLFAGNAVDTWQHWTMVSKIFLMTIVTIVVVNTWQRIRWFALTIAASFGFLVLKSLPFMIASGGSSRLYGPENSMIADNNDFGLALDLALPFFFFLAKSEPKRLPKFLLGFVFLATIPAIMFTYSRGAFLGMAVVLLCMMLQAKQKVLLIPVAMFLLVLAALLAPQAWRDRISNTSAEQLDASALSRINAWTYCWRLANDYPIMGGGFDTFTPELFDRYAPNPKDVHGPHSIYFGVLAEHGFPGLFLYFCLVGSCFWSLRRTIKLARAYGDERSVYYANMLWFALIGFLVAGAFLGRAYFDFYFTIVACVAVVKQLAQLEWDQDARDTAPEAADELSIGLGPVEVGV
jgi:putative inorganic carbon (HCO3(-)) transporter